VDFLGKKWQEVLKELSEHKIQYTFKITYPQGKVLPCGDLRVVRVNKVKEKLKFILVHDRFNK